MSKLKDISVSEICEYEMGVMKDEQMPVFFQKLIDSGMLADLDRGYSRKASDYIKSGVCKAAK